MTHGSGQEVLRHRTAITRASDRGAAPAGGVGAFRGRAVVRGVRKISLCSG